MKEYSDIEKSNLLNSYFEAHCNSYSKNKIIQLKNCFGNSYDEGLTEIYHALDMYDGDDPYVEYAKLIEKLYGLDINILEVGGGIYPALSDSISKRQASIGKGKITVYDPLLSNRLNLNGINLVKRNFNQYDDTSSYDLIISKDPCSATYDVINNANKNKKSLVLSPCNCYGLLPEYMEFDDDPLKQWYDYVYDYIDNYSSKTKTYHLDSKTHYNHPIYSKR